MYILVRGNIGPFFKKFSDFGGVAWLANKNIMYNDHKNNLLVFKYFKTF
jgi:hypothetical protein